MMHTSRTFCVADAQGVDELVRKLTEYTSWTLCTGFRCEGYLWLNDSFSENGAQEYAVVRESDMRQVESITVSWCTPARLRELATLLPTFKPWGSPVSNHIQTPQEHGRCHLCA